MFNFLHKYLILTHTKQENWKSFAVSNSFSPLNKEFGKDDVTRN